MAPSRKRGTECRDRIGTRLIDLLWPSAENEHECNHPHGVVIAWTRQVSWLWSVLSHDVLAELHLSQTCPAMKRFSCQFLPARLAFVARTQLLTESRTTNQGLR